MRWHDTCTIQRGTAETDQDTGEPTGGLDWTAPAETSTPCSIQPKTQQDVTAGGGEVAVGGWFGYFPAGTDLSSTDRVSWRGLTLTVDGEVAPWVVRGSVHHLECSLGSA